MFDASGKLTASPVILICIYITSGCTTTGTVDLPPPGGVVQGQLDVGRGQSPELKEDEGLLGGFAPKKVYANVKAAAGYGPDDDVAKQLYQEGRAKFQKALALEKGRSKAFLNAAKTLSKAAERGPDSAIKEDALFYSAEAYFFGDRYPQATEAYELLVKNFENTEYMDVVARRRFAIADYWIKHQQQDPDWLLTPNLTDDDRPTFDKFGHAVRTLEKIRLQDPTGKLADDATMRSALANFEHGRIARADELFEDLRRSYPSSDHQYLAHLFGVRCKLKIYQGPSYSMKPMNDAERLIRQIRIQFPQESQQHLEFLNEAWKEVRKNKALHDWNMANYYDRRKEFGAARQYYARLARDYSDTNLADKARQRIQTIADRPNKPKQKLPWLAKMFPTPEREKPLVAANPLDKLRR